MKRVLSIVMLAIVAILGILSAFQFALPAGWVPGPQSMSFRVIAGIGLTLATLIGGAFYWLDKRKND